MLLSMLIRFLELALAAISTSSCETAFPRLIFPLTIFVDSNVSSMVSMLATARLLSKLLLDEKDGVNYVNSSRVPSLPSLIVGGPGSYIPYPSHSFLIYLGPKVWMLMLDCR